MPLSVHSTKFQSVLERLFRVMLRRIRGAGPQSGFRVRLQLRQRRGVHRFHHWLEPHPGVRHRHGQRGQGHGQLHRQPVQQHHGQYHGQHRADEDTLHG